ncbi:MAG: TonB-dependent receptor [Haliscomenobacteraceae bacterium CHB4]|nr:Vitamin B12 transporter BtuB [Saprospiraceae bacterium]MCE7925288.1 TonB-dependent receptor [Haliscomenobacteraceae bacterium CHB4]
MKQLFFLFFFLAALGNASAQITLKGKVTDANGEALVGVTITERGTSNGTVSGADGAFTLNYSRADAVIVFSYTGYATQEVVTDGRSELNIAMEQDENLLDQIVIVGSRRANRTQTETPVPVDVINVGAVTLTTARADVTSLLNYTAPSFNYNKQSGSDGADHIDLATLRGLGPDQTLVLVNGKRRHQTAFVSVFGTRGRGNSGTDLSAIPVQAIDRVEILRDGASAQYGSDAIAGVMNIILKKNVRQFSADFGVSGYYDKKYNPSFDGNPDNFYEIEDGKKLDGLLYNVGANYGIPLGGRGGFLNLTLNYANQGKTFRQELDGKLPDNYVRRAHGDASMQSFGGMFNAEVPLKENDRLTFYTFGGYNRKESDAYAFTRTFSARPDRFPTDGGDLIEVPGIIKQDSSGEFYFNPHIQTEIQDVSFAAGIDGTFGEDWGWDLSNTSGYNDFHFFGDKTFNAGLGAGQTHFDDGGFKFLQNTTNLNFTKFHPYVLSGLNIAFGGEFRYENYQLFAGEEASYANYDTLKASGSQGFPGYQPADEVDANRSCAGLYGDAELDITDKFLVGAAVRMENYSDFGFTINGKIASRFKVADNFNLRASASTGFRAPSLQQINFSSSFTTVQGGQIAEVKIAPNYSSITKAAGIPELTEEKSVNASIGFSWKPVRELAVTVDGYWVQVKDRVVLSGQFSADDASLNPNFTGALKALNVSLAQFFANAVNTTNKGVDIVVDYNKRMTNSHFRGLLTANFQDMTIDKINVPSLLAGNAATFLSDREQTFILASAPPVKMAVTLEYGVGNFTLGTRLTYFGEVTLLGYGEDGLGIDPMVPTDDGQRHVPDEYVYGGKIVPDLYAGWKFNQNVSLNVGVDNFANIHPDLGYVPAASEWAFNNETGGPWDAVQMGGNGLRAFTRLSINF